MRRRLLAMLLAIACLGLPAVLTPTPALAAQWVTNGNFTNSLNGWNWPSQMGVENCCANPPGGYPNAYAHPNGAGSGTGLGAYLVAWQNIANAPSGTYTLSGRINSSGGAQSVWIQADNGVFEGRYCNTTPTNTASWITVSCSFTYTAGNTLHVAMVALNTPPTAWGWVTFDDISLTNSGGGGGTDTAPYDLATYLTRTDAAAGPVYSTVNNKFPPETMQMQYSAGRYYQVKNAHWEELSWDSSYIRRYRDTSDGSSWYGVYSNGGGTLGDNWIQRSVYVGTALVRNPTVKQYSKSGCSLLANYSQQSRIVVMNFYPTWNSGTGPTLNNVIQLRSQLPNGAGGWNAWEDYYYAKGVGLVKFVDYGGSGFEGHFTGFTSANLTRENICTP
jgi:hypothetical protein